VILCINVSCVRNELMWLQRTDTTAAVALLSKPVLLVVIALSGCLACVVLIKLATVVFLIQLSAAQCHALHVKLTECRLILSADSVQTECLQQSSESPCTLLCLHQDSIHSLVSTRTEWKVNVMSLRSFLKPPSDCSTLNWCSGGHRG
jgi:hypothetical protein